MVNCKFWSDNWIRGYLDPICRYLFLYLITNEHSNLCGIYELPISTLCFETGLSEKDLVKTLLPKLEPKILYSDGWVYITNYEKYHLEGSPMIKIAVEKSKSSVPSKIMDIFKKKLEGIDTLSPFTFTLTSTFTSKERGKNFTPPSFEEISKYCLERKNGINAQQFIDFYSAKGWMIGKNKMKDWQACIRTWEQRQFKQTTENPTVLKLR